MRAWICAAALGWLLIPGADLARAHFGALIPSDDIVSQGEGREIGLDVQFIHPMEGHHMQMDKPARFGVRVRGEDIDLLGELSEQKVHGFSTWHATYGVKRPGDHVFYVEPVPYWEPAEDAFIVHYTKVVVNAFGMESGWDEEVGLKTEIVPLSRPYGLWAGNVFQGVVKFNGKPVPHAEVEVEYLNEDGVEIPADPYVTQVVKADSTGVFTYGMPRAGWWGFAALSEDDRKIEKDGDAKQVEIGAVLWVRTRDMNAK
jgi:cobalt/nickel transport protein